MAFYVGNEQLLACTAGQVKSLGVDWNDIKEFKNQLNLLLPPKVLTFHEHLEGAKHYYSDRWRIYFEYFRDRYRFKGADRFQDYEQHNIRRKIEILIGFLEQELKEKRVRIKKNQAEKIIKLAIENFRDYYGEKYGFEFLNPLYDTQLSDGNEFAKESDNSPENSLSKSLVYNNIV